MDARTSVRTLLAPTPKDAAEQRRATRHAAARVIRAYRKAETPIPGDAVVCALAAAQFIDAIEKGLREQRKHRKEPQ